MRIEWHHIVGSDCFWLEPVSEPESARYMARHARPRSRPTGSNQKLYRMHPTSNALYDALSAFEKSLPQSGVLSPLLVLTDIHPHLIQKAGARVILKTVISNATLIAVIENVLNPSKAAPGDTATKPAAIKRALKIKPLAQSQENRSLSRKIDLTNPHVFPLTETPNAPAQVEVSLPPPAAAPGAIHELRNPGQPRP